MTRRSITVDETAAVVLAGGFGTRVRHLLPGIPKPMAPVAGRPFLEWVVRYLAAQSIRHVVLSTGHLSQVIEDHFRTQPVRGVAVSCAPETQPLGTAGGFLNAVRTSRAPAAAWLVLNGDSLCFTELAPLLEACSQPDIGGALAGYAVEDTMRYGSLVVDGRGELRGFREKQPGAGLINAGMYLFKHTTLAGFPDQTPLSFEQDVFPALARSGTRLRVCETAGPFLDIGTPETLGQAQRFVRENAERFAPTTTRSDDG